MSTDVDCPVAPGDVLAGKYRVERVLGAGSMGVVVAAMNLELGRLVALKLLLPEAAAIPEVVARFSREGRTAAMIRSRHVTRVFDVGALESGAPYIAMEYLEGRDLGHELEARGALPVVEVVDWLLEACDAIAAAHVAGIVHRDLKPANLFLARGPEGVVVKVVDFGVSKLLAPAAGELALTRTQALVGSPLYMAPEQFLRPKEVDARVDVWALGIILFELVTGRPPFDAETMPEVVAAILGHPTPALTTLRPDAPPALDAVVARCLEKEDARRMPDVGAFARAIAPFGGARAAGAAARITRILAGNASVPAPSLPAPRASAPTPRRGLVALTVAVAAIMLVVASALALFVERAAVTPAQGRPAAAK